MLIEKYSDSKKISWDQYVNSSKNGTFLFLRDYMEYHKNRFEDFSLIIRNEKSEIMSVFPANKEGSVIISHGGLTYGGFVTNEQMKTQTMLKMFDAILTFLNKNGVKKLIYKTIPYIYHKIPAEEDRYALFLCGAKLIRRDVLTVLSHKNRPKFQERRYRGIKKAEKKKLEVRQTKDLDSYWQILEENLKVRFEAKPIHTLQEIKQLHSQFPSYVKLFAAFKNNEMLGGVLIYESSEVAHVQYISANEEGREAGALDLTFHYLLSTYYREKPYFDFGASNGPTGRHLNGSLIDQKEGFGARAVAHDHYEISLLHWKPCSIKLS